MFLSLTGLDSLHRDLSGRSKDLSPSCGTHRLCVSSSGAAFIFPIPSTAPPTHSLIEFSCRWREGGEVCEERYSRLLRPSAIPSLLLPIPARARKEAKEKEEEDTRRKLDGLMGRLLRPGMSSLPAIHPHPSLLPARAR